WNLQRLAVRHDGFNFHIGVRGWFVVVIGAGVRVIAEPETPFGGPPARRPPRVILGNERAARAVDMPTVDGRLHVQRRRSQSRSWTAATSTEAPWQPDGSCKNLPASRWACNSPSTWARNSASPWQAWSRKAACPSAVWHSMALLNSSRSFGSGPSIKASLGTMVYPSMP